MQAVKLIIHRISPSQDYWLRRGLSSLGDHQHLHHLVVNWLQFQAQIDCQFTLMIHGDKEMQMDFSCKFEKRAKDFFLSLFFSVLRHEEVVGYLLARFVYCLYT